MNLYGPQRQLLKTVKTFTHVGFCATNSGRPPRYWTKAEDFAFKIWSPTKGDSKKNVTGAIASWHSHFMAHDRSIRFLSKVDHKVRIQREAAFLCIDIQLDQLRSMLAHVRVELFVPR
mmetsp:Transcript_46422/g.64482  ORF Transcript_46422/g.64482 Transcript_46422/m.64482 type:complete len:118 (+) Transcript_46422:90-443(+)